jgi:hypothetical protein
MAEFIDSPDLIKPGDIYEDSAFHPCLCVSVDVNEGIVWGISLIDGSHPRTCDLFLSGIRKQVARVTLYQPGLVKRNPGYDAGTSPTPRLANTPPPTTPTPMR